MTTFDGYFPTERELEIMRLAASKCLEKAARRRGARPISPTMCRDEPGSCAACNAWASNVINGAGATYVA